MRQGSTTCLMKLTFRTLSDLHRTEGGSELSCMSTSRSRDIAMQYASSERPLLFRFEAKGMALGVDITFLSCYPKEVECLYPPLTYLMQDGEVFDQGGITIVPITPQFS
jgi:hypothetical protein